MNPKKNILLTYLDHIVDDAIHNNDITSIQKILTKNIHTITANNSSTFTQDEKEQHIFDCIYTHYALSDQGKSFMEYIVFQYNISKENSIKKYTSKKTINSSNFVDMIEAMFELRDLNKELISDLPKNDKSDKKIKV
jgi:hypothetical protein